jgi:hypothetical protein
MGELRADISEEFDLDEVLTSNTLSRLLPESTFSLHEEHSRRSPIDV